MDNFLQHTIPVADWVENFTDWLTGTFSGLFSALQSFGQFIMDAITNVLLFVPPLLMIVLLTAAAFFVSRKNSACQPLLLLGCCSSIIKGYGQT